MIRDLSTTSNTYDTKDGIVIKNYVHGKEGGVVLDFTGFPDDIVCEGHGIILQSGDYKPQPVDGSLDTLLVGVARSHVRKEDPNCGVMTHGTINSAAAAYPFNAASLTALKTLGVYNQED